MMKSNKLRMAIQTTMAVAVLGSAGQAAAVDFKAGGYDASLYGYARLNATYDFDEALATSRGTRSANYSNINTSGADKPTGVFGADAVQSRLGVKVMTPEGVKVVVEGDFRGASGTSNGNLRLRHAYGEYNGWLMGQTWSNYNSFVGNTSQLDFDGIPGAAGYQSRDTQVRYTTGPLSFSLEQPGVGIASADKNADPLVYEKGYASKDSLPVATARFESSQGIVKYSAGGLVQQLGYDTGTKSKTTVGYAAFVAGSVAVTDMLSIQGAFNYTDGANQYLYRSGNNFAGDDAYVTSNGNLETISGYGGTIGASLDTGNNSSVNILYGMTKLDLTDAVAAGAYDALGTTATTGNPHEKNQMAAVNYQWTPVKHTMMGVQYAYHKTDLVNGDSGNGSRVQFAAQYNF